MAEIEKKERKLKKSEEKQIQKIVSLLEANPDAILWVELILYKFLESQKSKATSSKGTTEQQLEDFLKNLGFEGKKESKLKL
ncbi:hypothetical protein ACQV5M_15200 [Leptospira sp. SA-E8]|uniref:hypothetical protein n=1 Tax=Leptospira sp. SA-E8 TaxID=3422259 RepID=UPI003EB8D29E